MDNFDRIINILESYRYSKTYYDTEKDIAKLYLSEINNLSNRFYDKNELILIESGLDDYYISNTTSITESAGYVAKNVMNTIIKGLKVIGRSFTATFKASPKIETDKDKSNVEITHSQVPNDSGGKDNYTHTHIWKNPILLNDLLKKNNPNSYDPHIAEKVLSIVDRNAKEYNISCKLSNQSVPLNKYYKNNFGQISSLLPIITTNMFRVDPIGDKYCSINIVDLADFISRAKSAKDEHDFEQLLESILNSCDKSKEKGVKILANDNSVRKSCNKIDIVTSKIEKESERISNKEVEGNSVANTLKLAHESITALKEVTANTSKLYNNVIDFRNSCISDLNEYFKERRNKKNKLEITD